MSNELLWLIAGFSVGWGAACLLFMGFRRQHDALMDEYRMMNALSIRLTADMRRMADELRETRNTSMN